MFESDIRLFAQKNGFIGIKNAGTYKDYDIYIPIYKKEKKIIGYPQYIIVKNENISLIVDTSMEITKFLFN